MNKEWERDVEWMCKLARDQQQYEIVPSLHIVKSAKPASYWCLYDPLRPELVDPNTGQNDIRGWQEGQPDGSRIAKIDKRGQGCSVNAILEQLIPQEAGVPLSEVDQDPVDYFRNRRVRWIVSVVGGQGETDIEHGGGGGGGYAGGAWRGPVPDWPLTNWGFGVVGDWRLHFGVLARKLHGVDARDPAARAYLLDRTPDCRDRLMELEWREPRPNGGFAGQHPSGSFCHEASHGFDVDIHNPDLGERPDGTFFYTQAQRQKFLISNALYLKPIAVEPVPEPEPKPVVLSLIVPTSVSVKIKQSATFQVMADYGTHKEAVTAEVYESSIKFSAVSALGSVTVTAGPKPGDGTLVVRWGGVEKIVAVTVRKR